MKEKGATLIEIIIAVFIIAIFSTVLLISFPQILRSFALSRSAYKLAQEVRKVQDWALSGVEIKDKNDNFIRTKGYGIYINPFEYGPADERNIVIYADRAEDGEENRRYDKRPEYCGENEISNLDCIIEVIEVSENPQVYIKRIENTKSGDNYEFAGVSINFSPPNPQITIDNICESCNQIGIVLGLKTDEELERIIWISKSGLIKIE